MLYTALGGTIDITGDEVLPDGHLKELYHGILFYLTLGGTIDITVHEVQTDGHLKELYHANGGAWGGTFVDKVCICSILIL